MIILLRELSRNRKILIIWTLILSTFSIFLMTFYPAILDQADELNELMSKYPSEIVEAFNFDELSMSDPIGFYGTQTYLFITLFGSIYSMLLFTSIISKEENEGTAEFLLTRPVKRNRVLTFKALAAFVNITLFNIIFGIINIILFEIYPKSTYDLEILIFLIIGPWLMHLTFGFIGFLISVFVVKARSVYPLSIGVVLGAYFISILSTLTDIGKNLRYLTPFKYVDSADIIFNKGFLDENLIIMFTLIIISIVLTYIFYNIKDIKA